MHPPRHFSYNPKWMVTLGCIGFFGLCAAIMAYEASHNRRGVIIEGIIHLGPSGATIFYWVLSALGMLFVLLGLLLIVRRIANPQLLEFSEDALLLPHGFLQTHVTRIPYADITGLSETKVSSQTFLYIIAANRKFCITASLLPSNENYIEIREFLVSRTQFAYESASQR